MAKKLVKKGMPAGHGKSMDVVSLTMKGVVHVKAYLKDNPDAPSALAKIIGTFGR